MRQPLVQFDTPSAALPSAVDVAIVGGGAAGIAAARALAKRGVSVAVFEKGRVAAEQSSSNWGWCRTLGRDIREAAMAKLSVDLWRTLRSETGVDTGFTETGIVFVTDDPKEMETWERWLNAVKSQGLSARMLSAAEANATHAWQGKPWLGGVCTDTDGYAEPSRAIPLLAKYLAGKGVHILQECAVNELLTEGGRVSGVQTERGPVRAAQVVVAGGVWSSLFCRKHSLALPSLNVLATASRTHRFEMGGSAPVRAPTFSIRPRDDGGVLLARSGRGTIDVVPDILRYGLKFREMYKARRGSMHLSFGRKFFSQAWSEFRYLHLNDPPFERNRVLDPLPDMDLARSAYDEASRSLQGMHPQLLSTAWGGLVDSTPDGVPVVSGVKRWPGLYLSTGFSGHGFGSSLGAGHCLAQLMLDGKSELDLDALSYERLIDGRRLQPTILY